MGLFGGLGQRCLLCMHNELVCSNCNRRMVEEHRTHLGSASFDHTWSFDKGDGNSMILTVFVSSRGI